LGIGDLLKGVMPATDGGRCDRTPGGELNIPGNIAIDQVLNTTLRAMLNVGRGRNNKDEREYERIGGTMSQCKPNWFKANRCLCEYFSAGPRTARSIDA
jgi:hypothetical protein